MIYFLDTSALVKRYRSEKGTQILDEIFSEEGAEIIICSLSISEVASAINKHLQRKEIASEDFKKTIGRFYYDIKEGKIAVLDISRDTFFAANDFIFEYHLTSSDAIILTSCIELQRINPIFVCADTRSGLLYAAQSCLLSTLNPLSI